MKEQELSNRMKDIMKTLKERREYLNFSFQDLSKKTGISKSTLQRYETGSIKNIPMDKFEILSNALKIDPNEVLGYDNYKKGIEIPVVGKVVAGIPIEAIEEILDYEEITKEMASKGKHFGLKIKGDSMYPVLMENDTIIVREQSDIESGEIAVVLVNGSDATVKKVKKTEQGIMLIPINQDYETMFYTNEQVRKLPLTIVGRVVENRRTF